MLADIDMGTGQTKHLINTEEDESHKRVALMSSLIEAKGKAGKSMLGRMNRNE